MSKLFIANWKMELPLQSSLKLGRDFKKIFSNFKGQIVVCPDFLSIPILAPELKKTKIILGAQDCAFDKFGAYTGEVSAVNIKKLGVKYVILGHSERRQNFSEDDKLINRKIKAAQAAGLKVVLCVGESAQERCDGKTFEVIKQQIRQGLKGVSRELVVAYEPIWAIGSGRSATAYEAQEVHSLIKKEAGQILKKEIKVIYGGSLNAKNSLEFRQAKDVNGFLVGGSSLKATEFYKICQL